MLRREKYAPIEFLTINFAAVRLVLLEEAEYMPFYLEDISSFENAIEVTL